MRPRRPLRIVAEDDTPYLRRGQQAARLAALSERLTAELDRQAPGLGALLFAHGARSRAPSVEDMLRDLHDRYGTILLYRGRGSSSRGGGLYWIRAPSRRRGADGTLTAAAAVRHAWAHWGAVAF